MLRNYSFKGSEPFLFLTALLIFTILALLEYHGYIWHTSLFTLKYKIKGLDVSHHQKNIKWDQVTLNKYKFSFIKATEGMDMVDRNFKYNWKHARQAGFLVGAYHFFVTSSNGEEQAKNFIKTVPIEKNSFPPVIDIEIDIKKDKNWVHNNLTALITNLKKHYKKYPILYVTNDTYETFVMGRFDGCHIWIRNIFSAPSLKDKRKWTFWQYSNRGRVPGINTFVDLNVYHATETELIKMTEQEITP